MSFLGNIPLGYKFQVRQNSEAVHGIPEPSEFSKSLEYSYAKMSSDINQFLRVIINLILVCCFDKILTTVNDLIFILSA